MLLNRVISITKEKLSGGGAKYLGVYYHIPINMLILSFLKKRKKKLLILFCRLRFIVPV